MSFDGEIIAQQCAQIEELQAQLAAANERNNKMADQLNELELDHVALQTHVEELSKPQAGRSTAPIVHFLRKARRLAEQLKTAEAELLRRSLLINEEQIKVGELLSHKEKLEKLVEENGIRLEAVPTVDLLCLIYNRATEDTMDGKSFMVGTANGHGFMSGVGDLCWDTPEHRLMGTLVKLCARGGLSLSEVINIRQALHKNETLSLVAKDELYDLLNQYTRRPDSGLAQVIKDLVVAASV